MSTYDKKNATMKSQGQIYRRSMCKFLCDFVENNLDNAHALSVDFDFLVDILGTNFDVTIEVSKVIDAVLLAGSIKTAKRLPTTDFYLGVFEEIRKCNTSNYKVAADLLCMVKRSLVVGDSFLPLHQSQLLLLLINSKLIQYLVLYVNSNSRNDTFGASIAEDKLSEYLFSISKDDGVLERRNMILRYVAMKSAASQSSQAAQSAEAIAATLRYHADCVETLALTCGGRNLSNALKCSRIISFEVCTDRYHLLQLSSFALSLTRNIYVMCRLF